MIFNDIIFDLPITYCNDLHVLSKDVIDDLELSNVIHSKVFHTTNQFGTHISKEWCKYITSNTKFLEETQIVINNMKNFCSFPKTDTKRIIEVWDDTKCNPVFLEKYNFIDWEKFIYFNESPLFLQILSSVNVFSPIISLVIPIILLILPFFILQLRGDRISFHEYLNILKVIISQQFFKGQNISGFGYDKIIYMIMYFGLYLMQMYQNITTCNRFYNNIQTVNQNLIDFKKFIEEISKKMILFVELNKSSYYDSFCGKINQHLLIIQEFYNKLNKLTPFECNIRKLNDFGYLLSSYYELKNNHILHKSLCFSIGFDGYLDNLSCLYYHIENGLMMHATFDTNIKNSFVAKEQIYPPHVLLPNAVKNSVDLKKNIIITGPNASGKTTFLKTTAINIILSQQFSCGFYKKCVINPFSSIHSYLNIPDTSERDSLFQAETRRCKNILDTINDSPTSSRHFCIFDELYTGTDATSSSKASYSLLVYLCRRQNVSFMLTTHYKNVCKKLRRFKSKDKKRIIQNFQMDVNEDETGLKYLYKIKKGISTVNGAIYILKEMKYPDEIISEFINY